MSEDAENVPETSEPAAAETSPDHRAGFVAIVGRANVGKSTLLNRLVGKKVSIVGEAPQTTRHRVLGLRTAPEGQIAFLDSPGFHKAAHQLGELMLETARRVAAEADVVLFVLDAAAGIGPGDRFVLEQLRPREDPRPILAVFNKIDLINKAKVLPLIEQAVNEWGCREAVPVSATTGDNCDRLLAVVLAHLPLGPALFPPDFATDLDERRAIAELIREKVLIGLRQEVPHAIAVAIDRLETRTEGLVRIEASILVERESQKAIVIGRGGARLKEAGVQARRDLEERFGRQVYVRLWVKVRQDWRDKTAILRELGVFPE